MRHPVAPEHQARGSRLKRHLRTGSVPPERSGSQKDQRHEEHGQRRPCRQRWRRQTGAGRRLWHAGGSHPGGGGTSCLRQHPKHRQEKRHHQHRRHEPPAREPRPPADRQRPERERQRGHDGPRSLHDQQPRQEHEVRRATAGRSAWRGRLCAWIVAGAAVARRLRRLRRTRPRRDHRPQTADRSHLSGMNMDTRD